MKKYYTADRETGMHIDWFESYEEAKKEIEKYEEMDKKDGIYAPNCYDIVDDDHCTMYE